MDIPVIDLSKDVLKDKDVTLAWWLLEDKDIANSVFSVIRRIEKNNKIMRQDNIKNYKAYHLGSSVNIYANLYSVTNYKNNKITLNVIKSIIDTLSSKIAKQRPRVLFLTEGGDYKTRKQAKKLTKFIDGLFDEINHYETKQETFRDMLITGTGVTKFFIDWSAKKVISERVLPDEILVDELDALYGKPRCLYQRRFVNKLFLKNLFPEQAELIEGSQTLSTDFIKGFGHTSDLVEVVEAWHLRSSKDSNDGKHIICVSRGCLLIEDWAFDWFPFTFEKFTKPSIGFWSTGLVHDLKPIQEEINDIIQRIQESLRLVSVPKVLVEKSSRINKAALNNDIGTIIEYTGNPPNFYTPQAMTSEVYNYLLTLYNKCFEISGVSQLSAISHKPAGLNSGVAIREAQDIESERFHLLAQNRERSFLEDAKKIIALYNKIAEVEKKFFVKIASDYSFEQLNFKDLDLDMNKYILRTYPASLFPTQPAAKLQTVLEYVNIGFFDRDTALDLLDFPDIQNALNLELSPRRLILKQLENIIETGVYSPPEPLFPLDQAARLAQLFYLKSKLDNIEEAKLDLIRRYIEQCQVMLGLVESAQMQVMQANEIIQNNQLKQGGLE